MSKYELQKGSSSDWPLEEPSVVPYNAPKGAVNTPVSCKNCGNIVVSKFCPDCGQPADTPRVTRKMMWREFLRVYMNLDKGMIFTLKRMLVSPGGAPLDYVEGKRIIYMKPLTFIAISSALCKASLHKYSEDFSPWFEVQEIPQVLLGMILVGAILAKIFLKSNKFNFWEIVILQVFVHFLFLIVVAIAGFVLPSHWLRWFLVGLPPLYAMYVAVAFWGFYNHKKPQQMIIAVLVAALQTIILIKKLT